MGVSIKSCGYFFVTKSVCENKCITALINKKAGVRVTNIVLNITPAEYSKEPTNVTRPQWEREQTFAELIKQDALYCANNAESMEHFIFLLEKLGFEVKQGKHIAVKAPGVKKFKRLDTISEDFSRENLEQMFKTDFVRNRMTASRTEKFIPTKKAILTPYQRKCYVRMYRVHLADTKRFTYRRTYMSRYERCMSCRRSIY